MMVLQKLARSLHKRETIGEDQMSEFLFPSWTAWETNSLRIAGACGFRLGDVKRLLLNS